MSRSVFQWLARTGYVARGVVFLLVSALALFSGIAGGKPDTKSALDTLLSQPFGRVWISLIGVGLLGFVVWRMAQSLGNADNHKPDAKGFAVRAALFGSAIIYTGLACYAFAHAFGFGTGTGGEKGLAAWTMSQPFGRYLAGAVGIGLIVGGVVTIAKGVRRKYERYLDREATDSKLITFTCVYGLAARGALFAIVGGFLLYAAFMFDPDHAGSMADALAWLHQFPFGGVIYTLAAVGLASFGMYNFIEGRYRLVRQPEMSDVAGRSPC
jgi:hypothetical protein